MRFDGNYEVSVYQNGAELCSAVEQGGRIDLLFFSACKKQECCVKVINRLQKLLPDMNIVFMAADNDHAISAFSVYALHYLLKPISEEEVLEVFRRMERRKVTQHTLTIRVDRTVQVLFQDEIVKVESMGHNKLITLSDGRTFSTRRNFDELLDFLDQSFLVIRRGCAVNMNYIEKINRRECTLRDGSRYLISRKLCMAAEQQYVDFASVSKKK